MAISETHTGVSCNGDHNGSINVNVTGGTGVYAYQWSNGETTEYVSGLSAGTYYVVVTDENSCSVSIDVVITEPDYGPTVDLGPDINICQGDSITLDAGSGHPSYSWSTGEITQTIYADSAGTYFVIVTNANGCSATDNVVVTVNDLTINAGEDLVVCAGESVTLTASGAVTYSWDNGVTNGVSFIPTSTATYTVTGTNANGCSATDDVTVTVYNNYMDTVSLTACDSYEWNGTTYTSSGVYIWNGTNVLGCDSTVLLNLTINELPTVDLGSDINICQGDSTILDAGSGHPSYSWSTGKTTQTIYVGAGTYFVTVTNANGCSATDSITINIDCPGEDDLKYSPEALGISSTATIFGNLIDENNNEVDYNENYYLVSLKNNLIYGYIGSSNFPNDKLGFVLTTRGEDGDELKFKFLNDTGEIFNIELINPDTNDVETYNFTTNDVKRYNFKLSTYSDTITYVSPDGVDSRLRDGSINETFKTIAYAFSRNSSATECQMFGGNYFLEDDLENKTIKNYNDSKVIIDGTKSINELKVDGAEWTSMGNDIKCIQLKEDIWQLFYDREEITMARWPKAKIRDESVFDKENWAEGIIDNDTSAYQNGKLIDNELSNLDDSVVTGAIGVLNVGSFRTYTRKINSKIGNLITFDPVPDSEYKTKHHYYYLEGKLDFLTEEDEWFFDKDTKKLYVKLLNNEDPDSERLRCKVQTYALKLKNDMNVEGLNFYGTTLKVNGNDVTIKKCNFLNPSCYRRMLGEINNNDLIENSSTFTDMTYINGNNCTVEECVFKNTDGSAIETYGTNNKILDCYFNKIDYSVSNLSSIMTTIRMNGNSNEFSYNTIHKTGASSTLNPGNMATIKYNNIHDTGYVQSDGAIIQCMKTQQVNVKISNNWIHDTTKYGIRFDGEGVSNGSNHKHGHIHHNLVFNCEGGIMVKGVEHYVYNNTVFDSINKNDIIILNELDEVELNNQTKVYNNLCESLSGHRSDSETLNSRILSASNITGVDMADQLVNLDNSKPLKERDFRPISDSTGISDSSLEDLTNNIGAYFSNDSNILAGIKWNESDISDLAYVNENNLNYFGYSEVDTEISGEASGKSDTGTMIVKFNNNLGDKFYLDKLILLGYHNDKVYGKVETYDEVDSSVIFTLTSKGVGKTIKLKLYDTYNKKLIDLNESRVLSSELIQINID